MVACTCDSREPRMLSSNTFVVPQISSLSDSQTIYQTGSMNAGDVKVHQYLYTSTFYFVSSCGVFGFFLKGFCIPNAPAAAVRVKAVSFPLEINTKCIPSVALAMVRCSIFLFFCLCGSNPIDGACVRAFWQSLAAAL